MLNATLICGCGRLALQINSTSTRVAVNMSNDQMLAKATLHFIFSLPTYCSRIQHHLKRLEPPVSTSYLKNRWTPQKKSAIRQRKVCSQITCNTKPLNAIEQTHVSFCSKTGNAACAWYDMHDSMRFSQCKFILKTRNHSGSHVATYLLLPTLIFAALAAVFFAEWAVCTAWYLIEQTSTSLKKHQKCLSPSLCDLDIIRIFRLRAQNVKCGLLKKYLFKFPYKVIS